MTNICLPEEYLERLKLFLIRNGRNSIGKANPLSILTNYSAKRIFQLPLLACNSKSINLAPYFPSVADRTDPITKEVIYASGIYALNYYVGSYFLAINHISGNLSLYNKIPPNIYKLFYTPFYDPNPDQINTNTINPLFNLIDTNQSCVNERETATTEDIFTYYTNSTLGCYTTYKNNLLNYNPPIISPQDHTFSGCICDTNYCPPCLNSDSINPFECSPNCFPYLPNLPIFTVFRRQNNSTVPYPNFNLSYILHTLDSGLPLWLSFEISNSYYQKFVYNNNSSNYIPNLTEQGIWYADNSGDSGFDVGLILCGYINDVPAAQTLDGSNGVFIFLETLGTNFGNQGLGYITYNYFFNTLGNDTALLNNSSPVKQLLIPYINTNKESKYIK
jgi:hypothetical protein